MLCKARNRTRYLRTYTMLMTGKVTTLMMNYILILVSNDSLLFSQTCAVAIDSNNQINILGPSSSYWAMSTFLALCYIVPSELVYVTDTLCFVCGESEESSFIPSIRHIQILWNVLAIDRQIKHVWVLKQLVQRIMSHNKYQNTYSISKETIMTSFHL